MTDQTTTDTTVDDNAVQRQEMAQQIGKLAEKLRATADRIERHSGLLATTDREAAQIAADALDEYEQLNVGAIVWGIVRELGRTR